MIRLALIGVGRWGKNYIQTIEKIPDAKLQYICESNKATIQEFSNSYQVLTNYLDLKKIPGIDGIIIATPASTHFQIAKNLATTTSSLLIEKPIVTHYQEALAIEEMYKKKRPFVMVGHIYLYNPAFIVMKQLVKKLGTIRYVHFEGMQAGPIREDVSCLWDWTPHDIAMAVDLFGNKPHSVAAWGNKDMCQVRLTFSQNLHVFIENGWLSPVKKRTATIVGEKDAIIFDDTQEKKLMYMQDFLGEKKMSYPTYSSEQPLHMQVAEFVSCIKSNKSPRSDVNIGVKVVQILEAAEKSLKSRGKEVSLI